VTARVPITRTAGREAKEGGTRPVEEAAKVAAKQAEETGGLGRLGKPMDRRSLGIVGAFVAIPVAAALRLLLEEVTFRRLDRS
jgi:hypothetical protein